MTDRARSQVRPGTVPTDQPRLMQAVGEEAVPAAGQVRVPELAPGAVRVPELAMAPELVREQPHRKLVPHSPH